MTICANRIPIPGSPSTCALDTTIVPLPSFFLAALFPLFFLRSRKLLATPSRLPYPFWIHAVYLLLVLAAFAMTVLELARLSAQQLGVGLLPANTIMLFLVLVVLWMERRGRTQAMASLFCAYWLFFAAVETVKVVRLHVLDETIPNKSSSPNYPASDQLLDNIVMVALYWIFFLFELYTAIRMRKVVDKSRPLALRGRTLSEAHTEKKRTWKRPSSRLHHAMRGHENMSRREKSSKSRTYKYSRGFSTSAAPPLPLLKSSLRTFNDDLSFDNYTLILKGQRIFLQYASSLSTKSGGVQRDQCLPSYGTYKSSPGVMDFDGYRSISALYEAARVAGIWIYINGETTAGGLPHWTTTEIKSELRTTAPDWNAAWTPYIQAIISQTNQSQISNGGPVIAIQVDNEYDQQEGGAYFAEIEALYKKPSNGINVPLTHNDPGMLSGFINGTGAVDLYGMDAYPQGLVASNLSIWNPIEKNYHEYHEQVNPSQPWYSPEFQSGAFDGWGPGATGYEDWRAVTDADFVSVFYQHIWASNAKLVNYYMLVGGTSWDHGSQIAHEQIYRAQAPGSREFYKTDWIGTSASGLRDGAIVPSSPPTAPAFVTFALSSFKLNVTVASGQKLTIPLVADSIRLDGRESKTLTTDYAFGSSRTLYSTALVFFSGTIDGRDVLFLFGDSDQEHEVALRFTGNANSPSPTDPHIQLSSNRLLPQNTTIVTVKSGFQGLATLHESDTQIILFADKGTVSTFWSPTIASPSSADPFANYWSIGTNESVLVGGPYLVRSAAISGSELVLRGDLNATNGQLQGTTITIIAPSAIKSLTWNGESVSLSPLSGTGSSTRAGHIPGTLDSVRVPNLDDLDWKFNDSLPEVQGGFDDSDWAVANHTTTNIPFPMNYGDGRILYGCDYGFCENVVLWRGHFNATGQEKSVNLSVNGGAAFAASVWLNDQFLNTTFGNSTNNANVIEETDEKYIIPPDALRVGQDNVITIVQDNTGIQEAKPINDDAKSPRGVRGFQLNTGNFSDWRVQGKVGGYTQYLDKVRGVLNEGGLFGERQGWHLPGFDTSSWQSRKLSDGLPSSQAGVGFFVATFNLNLPSGYDVPMSMTFSDPLGQPYRLYMFVNGWMMGKRIANLGPQAKFPVHEGILNYHGENTVAIALWAMTPNVTIAPQLQLMVDGVFKGGLNVTVNNPAWSPEGRPIMSDWRTRCAQRKQAQLDSIPKEWLIQPLPDSQMNMMNIPKDCGLLADRELEITETIDVELILKMLASGEWSSFEVTTAFYKRAIVAQQATNCLTEIFVERALHRAKEVDEILKSTGKVIGPLHGLPISLKDQFTIKGLETIMGYAGWIGKYAETDSVLVEILYDCGAVPFVRTNVPQTLMWGETHNHVFGRTVNPYNRYLTAGGSSGGEVPSNPGALVAMKGSPLGVGTDIGGAFCGLYTLRPSYERLPYCGAVNALEGQESISSVLGPMTNSMSGVKIFTKAVIDAKPWLKDPLAVRKEWSDKEYELVYHGGGQKLCFGMMWDNGMQACLHP
ncbi:hypothetical protein D9757_005888 [Collybiopsis confluens]|uniref:beta-galactosidase n=1 Tax=Collybiopsis confluens TaxID=2823264 RepID=A0A8H5M9R7_9AGAR|nr:hypothetical protein D9757_005888 [Collybiopsis confluens]